MLPLHRFAGCGPAARFVTSVYSMRIRQRIANVPGAVQGFATMLEVSEGNWIVGARDWAPSCVGPTSSMETFGRGNSARLLRRALTRRVLTAAAEGEGARPLGSNPVAGILLAHPWTPWSSTRPVGGQACWSHDAGGRAGLDRAGRRGRGDVRPSAWLVVESGRPANQPCRHWPGLVKREFRCPGPLGRPQFLKGWDEIEAAKRAARRRGGAQLGTRRRQS